MNANSHNILPPNISSGPADVRRNISSSQLLSYKFQVPNDTLKTYRDANEAPVEQGNPWSQKHENDIAQIVLVHDPGLHVYMGTLHPSGSLYEQSVDLERAKSEHLNFIKTLEKYGVEVHTIRSILALKCDTNVRERLALEDLAFRCLTYRFDPGVDTDRQDEVVLEPQDEYLISDEYKEKCIAVMDTEQLVEIVMTNPTITLVKSDKDTPLTATSFAFKPLCNLTFTRDQQITTAKGIMMGRMSSPQRDMEVEVMKFCFQKLGLPVLGEVPAPGTLEGGDFFPAGEELCLIGLGLRTNSAAVQYVLDHDLWGTRRVAVVKDLFDRSQDRMHLDCVFNIGSYDSVVMLEDIMGDSVTRRLVDEWVRGDDGHYVLCRHDVEFSQYIKEQGYSIIPISKQGQLEYGCNFLNLGDSNIITVHRETARLLARDPHLKGNVELIEYRSITSMYGSVHCSSQVIKRVKPSVKTLVSRQEGSVRNGMATASYPGSTPTSRKASVANLSKRDSGLVSGMDGLSMQNDMGNYSRANSFPMPQMSWAPPSVLFPRTLSIRPKNGIPQSTNSLMMVAPTAFYGNQSDEMTRFYRENPSSDRRLSRRVLQTKFSEEFSRLHHLLTSEKIGVDVHLFHVELYHKTPNAVFCNNSLTTHTSNEFVPPQAEATLVIYPMRSPDRRHEVRPDIKARLLERYQRVVDLSSLAAEDQFLEGAGSLVLHRPYRTAYLVPSERSSPVAGQKWAHALGYELVVIKSCSILPGIPVLHTNLLLCIGTSFAIFCADLIDDPEERSALVHRMTASQLEVITITLAQAASYCANCLEVCSSDDQPTLIMSSAAYNAFTQDQLATLGKHVSNIYHTDMATFESVGGGSVRSTVAELF